MTEAASAAEALSGQGDAPPAEGQQPGNASNEAPWFGDSELAGYIENKGWKEPVEVINGYKNLEKILGDKANALVMPKEDDPNAWNEFYSKLGRPETPDGYEFPATEGQHEGLTEWFKGAAHKLGLTKDQAAKFHDEWNAQIASMNTEAEEEVSLQSEQDLRTLKKEWGNEYQSNIRAGQMAAKRFGFTEEEMTGMEKVIGTKAMLERFAKIGRGFGEDGFEQGSGGPDQFGLTPAVAREQINQLKVDSDFQKRYLNAEEPGHKEAVEKMRRLQEAANPEG